MNQIYWYDVSNGTILFYNIVLLIGFLFFCCKYSFKKDQNKDGSLYLLIVFIFFNGMFSDFSNYIFKTTIIFNVYKIIVFFWSLLLLIQNRYYINNFKDSSIFLGFFCLYFILISISAHKDSILLVFSQVSKYIVPFCLLISMFAFIHQERNNITKLNFLFKQLLIVQIFFCIIKVFLLKGYLEGWVGSLSGLRGGGAGTSLPLLVLCWLALNTDMKISFKNIIFIIGLLFIGFMTGKRAIWFLLPVLFILLYVFVSSKTKGAKIINKLIPIILGGFVLFYLGLRVSPTLNPDNKVWGRFDPQYALNYGMNYSAGVNSPSEKIQNGEGRVGAVLLMINEIEKIGKVKRVAIGVGNEYMVYASHDDYSNPDYYFGVRYRGGITGIVMMYFTIGIIGVVLFLFYFFSLFPRIKFSGFRWVLLLTILFDFVFYNAQIINMHAMSVLLMFIILYSNYKYDKYGNYINESQSRHVSKSERITF